MADFSKPATGDVYTSHFQSIRDGRESVAKWFDATTDSNLASGFKRWSATNRRFENYNGTAWGELLPMADNTQPYQIRVARANNADSADSVAGANVSGTVASATNAANLGSVPAAQYVQTTDSRMTNSRQCNNSFDSPSTARGNLAVYSQTEVNNALGYKADVASPTFTGMPAAPTAAVGTNTTQLATTAFVQLEKTRFGSWVDISSYANTSGGWTIDTGYVRQIISVGSVIGAYYYVAAHSSGGGADGTIANIPKALGVSPSSNLVTFAASCRTSSYTYVDVAIQSNSSVPANTTVAMYVPRDGSNAQYVRVNGIIFLSFS